MNMQIRMKGNVPMFGVPMGGPSQPSYFANNAFALSLTTPQQYGYHDSNISRNRKLAVFDE